MCIYAFGGLDQLRIPASTMSEKIILMFCQFMRYGSAVSVQSEDIELKLLRNESGDDVPYLCT